MGRRSRWCGSSVGDEFFVRLVEANENACERPLSKRSSKLAPRK